MKCKKGFKSLKGKCKKVKPKRESTLTEFNKKRIVTIILFFVCSLIVFVNDVTDLFIKLGLEVSVYYIGWAGIISTAIYTWWLNLGGGK